jgi:diadenosine tetraphosphatase ApaH/serine/threonine PP2A family protein phosphatase
MRLALIADVHGNAAALRAVLDDAARAGHDGLVLLGDYALFGPRPGECVAMLKDLDAVAIVGNTDEYVLGRNGNWRGTELLAWTQEDIGADGLAWLEARPFDHRVGGVHLFHANPKNTEDLLILERDPEGTHAPTTDDDARPCLAGFDAALGVFGHIHYASAGTLCGARLASIGSAGMPFDRDPRAAWALLHAGEGAPVLEHRRVGYDYAAVAREIERSGTPLAAARARRIRLARPVPLTR